MKTKVINLKRRSDRLSSFLESNKEFLSQVEVFEAIDGTRLSYDKLRAAGFDTDKNWRDPLLGRTLTWGEIACFLSHYALWEECADGEEPYLIFEDDVVCFHELSAVERDLFGQDLLYLAYSEQKMEGIVRLNERMIKPCYPYWLAAYAISPEGARKLVDTNISQSIIPCDEYVPRMLDKISSIAYVNQPCGQKKRDESGTDIEPKSEECYAVDFKTHVLTCSDSPEKMSALTESASEQGIEVTNVLVGPWKGGTMEGPGGGQKINQVLNYIESNSLPDSDVILFVDGHDVFFSSGLDTILGRYLGYKKEIVFSAEQHLWPDKSLAFPPTHTKYRYLNSGTWIGRVGEFKQMCSGQIQDHEDDQLFLQKAFLTGKYDAILDVEGYTFQTHEEEVIVREGQIFNPVTSCFSCVYHGNGGGDSKAKFDSLWKKFNAPAKYAKVSTHKVIGPEMILIDFLTPELCREWIRISEEDGSWDPHPDDRFPSHDIHLKKLGLYDEIKQHWSKVIAPICERYWRPYQHLDLRKAFTMKYSEDTQKTLGLHTDASLVTGSVKLNDDYEGATLIFPRQGVTNKEIPIGKMLLFPGQVTHGHFVDNLISGTKYSATFWTSRYNDDYLNE